MRSSRKEKLESLQEQINLWDNQQRFSSSVLLGGWWEEILKNFGHFLNLTENIGVWICVLYIAKLAEFHFPFLLIFYVYYENDREISLYSILVFPLTATTSSTLEVDDFLFWSCIQGVEAKFRIF